MKEFDYVIYNNTVCILIDRKDSIATIAGVMAPETCEYYFAFEIDTSLGNIGECKISISPKSIIGRLRKWRIGHPDIFGFMDNELSLIHPF